RRQAPKPRGTFVERIERTAGEDEREAEKRGSDEARAEIRERGRGREAPRDERPPEEQASEDQQRVFDAERPAGAQRPVVEARDMRAVPGCEPRKQGVPRANVAQSTCIEPGAHRGC